MGWQKGQTLVVVLLVLAVALTVGLSIASRGISEVRVASVEDEASRALAAAEAGVEASLGSVASTGVVTNIAGGGSSYVLNSSSAGGGSQQTFGERTKAGDVATVYLSGRDGSGNLRLDDANAFDREFAVCWGNAPDIDINTPAVVLKVYYYDGGNYGVAGIAYDPVSARAARNGFVVATSPGAGPCMINGAEYGAFWVKNINLVTTLGMPALAKPLALRMRLVYNGETGQALGVVGDNLTGSHDFPVQGVNLVSEGQAGSVVRKLSVYTGYGDPPSLFDGPIFTGTGGIYKP